MLGGTSDISQLCDHGFYDWVIFRYNPIQCPHEKPVLSRYLGTAIDFGPEIIAKIMKANSKVVHHSTYRGIKEDYKSNQAHVYLRKEFNDSIRDRFGPDILLDNVPDVNLEDTPLYDM